MTGTLEDGAAPAYGPWLDLVRAAQRRSEAVPAALGRLLEGESRVMHGVPPTAMASTIADDVATQAIELAGQRGLVFLIEDLQWADPASLNLLSGLAPRLGTAPVLVLVTVRDLEIGRNDAVVETLGSADPPLRDPTAHPPRAVAGRVRGAAGAYDRHADSPTRSSPPSISVPTATRSSPPSWRG